MPTEGQWLLLHQLAEPLTFLESRGRPRASGIPTCGCMRGHTVVEEESSLPSGRTCRETRGCWAGAAVLPRGVRKTDVDFHSPSGNTPCPPKSGFPDSAPRHACSRLRGKSLLQGGMLTLGGL